MLNVFMGLIQTETVDAIAEWRAEREFQDMMGLGPEAAQRSRRSAEGLRELANHIAGLPDDDARLTVPPVRPRVRSDSGLARLTT